MREWAKEGIAIDRDRISPKRWVVERTSSWLGQNIVPFSEGVVPKERPAKPRKRG